MSSLPLLQEWIAKGDLAFYTLSQIEFFESYP
jgi:hypothetical protein